ncbi:MAG: zinc ABC transporter substrate-binding protein [Desulfuromonas sp.]|nr:MAG: zinc ABC transporter substrate-binding protein [Desulfuromonas sp.]
MVKRMKTQGFYHIGRLLLRSPMLLILLALLPAPATAGPAVVASIKPIHSLVANLMQGAGEPTLLVRAGGSPHGYNLRPSEVHNLEAADLVVWVGPQLESFMVRPLANLELNGHLLTLLEQPEMTILPSRRGGVWGEGHGHDHTDGAEADHDDDRIDPHIWLAPSNAAAIADAVARKLVEIDPGMATVYNKNLAALKQRLQTLQGTIEKRLRPLRSKHYIVFHDAYQYFEQEFDLHPLGALAIDPDRRPGARRLAQLQQTIRDRNVTCIYTEPQFTPRLADILAEGSDAGVGILDPLGADLDAGPELYFTLIEQMATALEGCRSEER